jgi:hypothetical protein
MNLQHFAGKAFKEKKMFTESDRPENPRVEGACQRARCII